jgi:hypothetical protein
MKTVVAKLWPIFTFPTMRKSLFTLAALLVLGGGALADTFRAHYSIRGSGRDITVHAESSAEARRTGHGYVSRRSGDGRQPRQEITDWKRHMRSAVL